MLVSARGRVSRERGGGSASLLIVWRFKRGMCESGVALGHGSNAGEARTWLLSAVRCASSRALSWFSSPCSSS